MGQCLMLSESWYQVKKIYCAPQHRCNPLDLLDLRNPRFHADCNTNFR